MGCHFLLQSTPQSGTLFETRLVAGVISYNEVLLEKGGPLSPCDDRVLTKVGSLGTDARRENAAR